LPSWSAPASWPSGCPTTWVCSSSRTRRPRRWRWSRWSSRSDRSLAPTSTPAVTLAELITGRLARRAVGAYIGAAYWFTSSTSVANPAATVARTLSDTFAGIAAASAPGFIAAQLLGAGLAVAVARVLFREQEPTLEEALG
jgi:hypothetical protein